MECHILKVPKLNIPALEVCLTLSIMSHFGIFDIKLSHYSHDLMYIFCSKIQYFCKTQIEHFANLAR